MIQLPSSSETEVIADWAELCCLFGERHSLSRSKIEQVIEDAGIEDHEFVISNIWQEINRRNEVAGGGYPVKAFVSRIETSADWNEAPVYVFQLLVASHSLFPKSRITGKRWNRTAKLFENLGSLALQKYLGGRSVNVGAPRESGVPKGFQDCLDYLSREIGELRGSVKIYNSKAKDEKVDIVAWNPFIDNRAGQVIILGHCAAGADWKDKVTEVSVELWSDYINWVANPIVAFVFPFVCLNDKDWRYLSRQTRGFLMDRLRIASVLSVGSIPDTMKQTLITWCQSQQQNLPRSEG
jgi:hypothetical protein